VQDGAGSSLGTGRTGDAADGDAEGGRDAQACSVEFSVEVPPGPQYEISVGDAATEVFTQQQLESVLFRPVMEVEFIGSPPFAPGDVEEAQRVAEEGAEGVGPGPVTDSERPNFDFDQGTFGCESGQLAFVDVAFGGAALPQVGSFSLFQETETVGLMVLCKQVIGGIPGDWEVAQGPLFGE
jgi:hypothetical protein